MSLVSAKKIHAISQSTNPKLAIINAVGDISREEVLYDLVLVGTYIRPEKTAGGIIRPIDNVREDEYQGKIGLVLKMGPEVTNFTVGEWIVYSIKDAWAITMNNTPCRLVPAERIRMKVSNPDLVF